MDYLAKIIGDIEVHDAAGIRECFASGLDPNSIYNGKPLFEELTSEYARTPRFRDCVKAFVEHGLLFEDRPLLAVLLDDAPGLEHHLINDPGLVNREYTMRCAYTPLAGVTLLHVCAEFNHVACAAVLVRHGADVNATATTDHHGFGGHTPIFHTVNQNSGNSDDMLNYLLTFPVDLELTVRGLVWGAGYPWETLIPAVNPISYAMMGLLPQMHRNEAAIAGVVSKLLKAAYGIDYSPPNVPNKYLSKATK